MTTFSTTAQFYIISTLCFFSPSRKSRNTSCPTSQPPVRQTLIFGHVQIVRISRSHCRDSIEIDVIRLVINSLGVSTSRTFHQKVDKRGDKSQKTFSIRAHRRSRAYPPIFPIQSFMLEFDVYDVESGFKAFNSLDISKYLISPMIFILCMIAASFWQIHWYVRFRLTDDS